MYFIISLIINLLIIGSCYADSKMSAYTTEQPALTDTDVYIKDPSGTPANRKGTVASHFLAAGMTVDGTNVGLASTSPGTRLDVTGTVRATAFSGDGSGLTGVTSGWTDGGTSVYSTTLTDNFGIGTIAPAASLTIDKDSTDPYLHINSSAGANGNIFNIDNNGNIGIGTTGTGSHKLLIGNKASAANITYTVLSLGNTKYSSGPSSGSGAAKLKLFENSIGGDFSLSVSNTIAGGAGIELEYILGAGDTDNSHVFYYGDGTAGGPTELMRIVGNGNVGIGTFTTNANFVVQGSGSTSATDAIRVRNSANTQIFNVNNAGNVGIGSAVPGAVLDVVGNVRVFTATSGNTVKTGANTACNTTCAGSKCIFGVDDTDKLPLACTGATADTCVCEGP